MAKTYSSPANAKRAACSAVEKCSDDAHVLSIEVEKVEGGAIAVIILDHDDVAELSAEDRERLSNFELICDPQGGEQQTEDQESVQDSDAAEEIEDDHSGDEDQTDEDDEQVHEPPDHDEELDKATMPKVPKGYIRESSKAEKPTKLVWAIADSMPGAPRGEVIEECRRRGIAYGTARTQYQRWRSATCPRKPEPVNMGNNDA